MRLGLLSDIHEAVEYLQIALGEFAALGIDQVIVLGDLFEMGSRIDETCQILDAVNAIGVWGNHDYGLCVDPEDETREKYRAATIRFMTSLKPRLDVDGCHFAHVEPWLDPENIIDLWYFEGPPDSKQRLQQIFNAVPHQLILAGHYHRWLLATPRGVDSWEGERSLCLRDGRHFVTVGALCEGRYAILDTDELELTPLNCRTTEHDP